MMDDWPHLSNALLLLWISAVALMGSPGPATLSLAGIGASYGLRAGLPYLGGIIIGTTGVLFMVASGVTALILAQPALVTVLTTLALVYIVYLAWKIATAPVAREVSDGAKAPAFVPGLLLAVANPKAYAAIGAVYSSQTLVPGHVVADSGVKVGALAVVILIVNTAWLSFGASLSRLLRHPTIGRLAHWFFAVLLLASVGMLLVIG